MYKLKGLRQKSIFTTVLYLSFIIFGIVIVSWSISNILIERYPKGIVEPTYNVIALPEVLEVDKNMYPIYPAQGDNIGVLIIPSLNQELPILQGTNAKELKKGVGHFILSVLPGEKDNCVISGHSDTVFRKIGELQVGDELVIKTSAGKFIYIVSGTRIVDEDDKTVIVPTDHAVLTMTTCYPFNIIASVSKRYIVSANLEKEE